MILSDLFYGTGYHPRTTSVCIKGERSVGVSVAKYAGDSLDRKVVFDAKRDSWQEMVNACKNWYQTVKRVKPCSPLLSESMEDEEILVVLHRFPILLYSESPLFMYPLAEAGYLEYEDGHWTLTPKADPFKPKPEADLRSARQATIFDLFSA